MSRTSDNPIPLFKVFMSEEVDGDLLKVLHSGYIAQGPKVEEFEYRLRQWFDLPHVLTVNSGTSALQLACTLAGVGPNTEQSFVISTPVTCTATNTAIRAVGGGIMWADVDPHTGNIDPNSVEDMLKHAGRYVRAIMAVDWGGNPCDWAGLRYLADKYDVALIEDAAHAFGARYGGRHVGAVPDFTCFSFQAIKHLTTIDGGALVVRDEAAYRRGKLLRWFGIDRDQPRKDFRCEADVVEPGYKYHMNDVCATVGIANLAHMPWVLEGHRANARYYNSRLYPLANRYPGRLQTVLPSSGGISSYWLYTLLVGERERFMHAMQECGVTVSQVHARNDTHTMFNAFQRELPGVDWFMHRQCNIPVGWWLTEADRAYIADAIIEFMEHA